MAAALGIPDSKADYLAAKYQQHVLPLLTPAAAVAAAATDPASDGESDEH